MSVSVSVVIPALNEERTVAHVVRACLADEPLEVIVIDADSTDETAAQAAAAGARVCNWRDVVEEPPQPAKASPCGAGWPPPGVRWSSSSTRI